LGIARAHLGEHEAAQRAFVCALALDPGLHLASDEAVEVRSPFMEARGFWSLHAQRLSASIVPSEDGSALLITLVDPAALTARAVVRVREVGQSRFQEWSLTPAAALHVSLEAVSRAGGIEYSLALIDENANRLYQVGSDAEPVRALDPAPAPAAPSASPRGTAPSEALVASARLHAARPYYVGAAVSLVLGAGALAVAGFSHHEREQLAARWNSGDCGGEGSTRGEVCGHERDQLDRYQRLAIGFYAAGGAALVAGLVTLLVAPNEKREQRVARRLGCQPGPGLLSVACAARF
jgi:hypothetical protein